MSDLFLQKSPPQSISANIPDHLEPMLPHQPVPLASIARGYSNPNTISDKVRTFLDKSLKFSIENLSKAKDKSLRLYKSYNDCL